MPASDSTRVPSPTATRKQKFTWVDSMGLACFAGIVRCLLQYHENAVRIILDGARHTPTVTHITHAAAVIDNAGGSANYVFPRLQRTKASEKSPPD